MNQVQEIIVYRNPGEKAMWDMMMSADAFPIMAGVLLGVIVAVLTHQILGGYVRWLAGWRNEGWVYVGVSVITAVAAWWLLRV